MSLSFDLPISFVKHVCLFLNLFCFYVLLYLCVSSSTFSSSLLCSFLCLSLIVVNFLPSLCPIFSVNHSDFLPVFLSICLSVSLFYFYVPHLFPSFLLIFLSICLSVSLFCFYVPHLFTSFLFIFLSICLSVYLFASMSNSFSLESIFH